MATGGLWEAPKETPRGLLGVSWALLGGQDGPSWLPKLGQNPFKIDAKFDSKNDALKNRFIDGI